MANSFIDSKDAPEDGVHKGSPRSMYEWGTKVTYTDAKTSYTTTKASGVVGDPAPSPGMSTRDKLILGAATAGFLWFVYMTRPDTAEEKAFYGKRLARSNPRRRARRSR